MASSKDVADIFGMTAAPKQLNKKKRKIVEAQPRLSGLNREVQALMGDSVPPVAIVEAPKYKSRPSLANKLFKPRHWEERPFEHRARTDGLVLKHWKRSIPFAGNRPPANDDAEDATPGEGSVKPEPQFEEEFAMDRWNIKIKMPTYTDEQYDKHFHSDDWTREETDYLLQLCADFDLRWFLVVDRYDPDDVHKRLTNGESTNQETSVKYPERSMEQMKSRWYQIAAKDLELRTPASNMTQSEFQLWEKMKHFDAKTETMRKVMSEKLFERTKDEAEEERTLLEELSRITKNEDEFIAQRRDLYARLEAAPSLRRNERGEEQNIVLSSAGLGDLLSRLFAKEKHFKRRVLPQGDQSGVSSASDARNRQQGQPPRRDTLDTLHNETSGPANKKAAAPVPKQLTKAEEEKYGIVHSAERLTSGVMFRHEKINRITTAKSQVQTQKINAALVELSIPNRLSMPTEKVCKEFERLVSQIQLLLDARKNLGRVQEEVKVLEEMRRQRLGEPAKIKGEAVNAVRTEVADSQASTQEKSTQEASQGVSTGANEPRRLSPVNKDEPDEEDAEAEDDSQVREEDDDDDNDEEEGEDQTQVQEDTQMQEDEEEEEEEEDEEDAEELGSPGPAEEEGDDDEDEDDEGDAALREGARNVDTDDDDDEAAPGADDEDEDEDENEEEEEEEGEEEDEQDDPSAMPNDASNTSGIDLPQAKHNEADEQDYHGPTREQSSRPASSRGHKRDASSELSEGSRADSARSRKRRRG